MVSPGRGRLTLGRSAIVRIVNEDFPAVACLLKCIQVKGDEVVEKVSLNLSTEYVYS